MGIDADIIPNLVEKKKYTAFCGIGQPEKFKATLKNMGLEISDFHAFPDHYFYTSDDEKQLLKSEFPLITTAKDAVKLSENMKKSCTIVHIKLKFKDEAAISRALDSIFER